MSMDVKALYPLIPWKEGLEAMEEALMRREDHAVPDCFLLRLILIVLGSNIFEFDVNSGFKRMVLQSVQGPPQPLPIFSWASGKRAHSRDGLVARLSY